MTTSNRAECLAESPQGLPVTYQVALQEHLARPCRASLALALELGRAARDGGLGLPDLVSLHHEALVRASLAGETANAARLCPALDSFLMEVLSPLGLAPYWRDGGGDRGYGEAAGLNEALAIRNGELEEEIAEHRRVEAAMQESKDHYFQLYQNARAMEESLHELSAQVLSAQEEERKRISRELHDEIGQALTAINVTIAMLKRQVASDPAFQRNVADAEQLLERTMETVHCFARELRPAMLDHLGLQSALRAHILIFTRQTGIRTELVPHPHVARLDERRGEVLFRVAQEALNNIFKHARATTARIAFTSTGDFINMEVGDDGCAFNVDERLGANRSGCLGLLGMQERVRLVNGSFSIESAAGNGTRVRVGVPLGSNGYAREGGGLAPVTPHPDSYTSLHEEDIRSAR